MKKIIELQNIKRNFQVGDETVHALRGISFTIYEGEFVTIDGYLRLRQVHSAEYFGMS